MDHLSATAARGSLFIARRSTISGNEGRSGLPNTQETRAIRASGISSRTRNSASSLDSPYTFTGRHFPSSVFKPLLLPSST